MILAIRAGQRMVVARPQAAAATTARPVVKASARHAFQALANPSRPQSRPGDRNKRRAQAQKKNIKKADEITRQRRFLLDRRSYEQQ